MPSRAADSLEIVRDSAGAPGDSAFQSRLVKYRHDTAVIDSLTREVRRDPIIRSDSLYKVYRLALRPEGVSVAEVNLLWCLEGALAIRYGRAPRDRVVSGIRDTVYRDHGIKDALEFFLGRAPDQGALDSSRCTPEPVVAPNPLNGTSTDVEPTPPRRR